MYTNEIQVQKLNIRLNGGNNIYICMYYVKYIIQRKSYGNRFWTFFTGDVIKPCKILSMGFFFLLTPSPPYERFRENKVDKCYLPGKSVFMEGPAAFLRCPYISIFIKLCHSTFIYFILPLSSPSARTGTIKVASARGSRGCRTSATLVTRPYDPLRIRAQERVFCEASFMANTLVNLVMRLCKWKLQIQMDDRWLLDRGNSKNIANAQIIFDISPEKKSN